MEKDLFRNDSGHGVGVGYTERGKKIGQFLPAGSEVLLDEDQQLEVAHAPRDPKNNPFENGTLVLVARSTELKSVRKIGADVEPVGATPKPVAPETPQEAAGEDESASEEVVATEVPEGSEEASPGSSEGEEVGTDLRNRDELLELKRAHLESIARNEGVSRPQDLQNKGAVADAILEARSG